MGVVDGCDGCRPVCGKLKDFFKAGNIENALGYNRDIAEDKTMSLLGQEIA